MTVSDLIAAVALVFSALVYLKRRPKESADSLQTVVNLRKDYEVLFRDLKEYRHLIKEVKKNYQICQLNHEVSRLELVFLRKQTGYKVIDKVAVLMVDDEPLTDEEFKRGFGSVSIINYKGYSVVSDFLEVANLKQAPFLIIDYKLPKGWTADDVIKQIRYSPEKIFIISISEDSETKISSDNIVFFKKDDFYVYHIEMAIIKYLTDKIKS